MSRRLLLVLLACMLASGGVATSAAAQSDGGGSGDSGEATSDLPQPVVDMLDPGDEPRAPLRYALTTGTTSTATQTVDQSIRQVDQDGFGSTTRVPTIDLGLQLTVLEVLPDGTARVGLAFTSVDATGNGSAQSSDQARAIEIALADITDLTGESTITDRGVVLAGGYEIPEGLPDTVKALIEQYESQLQSVSPPLPEEALGVGARWRATTELDLGGIEARQTYDYTVESVSGPEVELSVRIRQIAKPQDFEPPGARKGDEYRLLSLKLRGKGSMTLDLTTPIPVEAAIEGQAVQKTRTRERGGDTETVTATIDQEQLISTP
jgi:hypothetical protein